MDLSLAHIERCLAAHQPNENSSQGLKRAAVACLLRYPGDAPEVLLMRRAERPGDRWSGQVSFPGGREEPHDPELRATAVRETREEVGIDLDRAARFLGRLDTIRAVARGGVRPLTITPFVFVQTEPVTPQLNHEAVEIFWLPLERAAGGELSGHHEYQLGEQREQFPCWRYQGHIIWGMTFHMLGQFLRLVGEQ
jgi:8-oxo-dGTP pyrophosphatase MutT (NUDIX family)